ncbi:sulfite exporter TauE/SafE family protein [Fibrella forsythiae]|uniref:Sulfite exporter TauE/SafE family protein n=1 Tax=Fibrella forsythiae TaxID=2817061 RepID=A0ABS3JHC8_9BACT|nr:sulfite exporter TauE/SafE family protein [Fibrella forsythiae]MBO0949407.1 sulfite exporter TauE/SafE family protein [Fibrella forsythiae]
MNTAWLLTALTTGLVGSLHCVGMCGPLAMALPVGRLPQSQRAFGTGTYHLARLTAYAVLGTLLGSVGQGLLLLGLQRPISIGAGLFLLVWTLLARGKFGSLTAANPMRWLVGPMSRFLQRPSWRSFAALGFLNGLLPCGFVYVALAGAISTGNAFQSAAYMVVFGVGTVPALLLVRSVPTLFPPGVRRHFTRLMPIMAVGVGVLLLARGLYQPGTSGRSATQSIPVCHGPLIVRQ